MPSLLHEGVINLVRDQPAFAADLLTGLLHVDVPQFVEARLADSTLTELIPIEFRADAVVLLFSSTTEPVFGVIVEAQLQPERRKRYSWPVYVTTARAHHECEFILMVVTPYQATATWAAKPISIGGGMVQHPRVIGPSLIPKITDFERAMREPQLALLSVIAHGNGDVAVAITLAATAAIEQLPDDQHQLYSDLIESALSEAARKIVNDMPQIHKYFSESNRKAFDDGAAKGKAEGEARGKAEGEARGKAEGEARGKAEGEARGKAEGEANAVLKILARRGIAVTEVQRRQITECQDLEVLDRWLDRSLSATSADELLA